MNRILRQINKSNLKEDSRKLGLNLLTASFVAGFITHTGHYSWIAITLVMWVGLFGLILWMFGLHQRG